MNHPATTRREWRNVLLFAMMVMTLMTLPYLLTASAQTDQKRFGWFMFGSDDSNSYLAKMREGAVGDWTFHLVYTSEPHDSALLFLPYLLGGKIAALLAPATSPRLVDAMLLVFHAARIGFGMLLIVVMYRFLATFIIERPARWLALTLICLGSGFGWLLLLLGQGNWLGSAPIDLISPEGYSFYLLYGLPHLSLARAALFGGLLFIFAALNRESGWQGRSIAAGVCWLVMGLCVPFYVGVLYLVLGVWGLATWLRNRRFPTRLFWRCSVAAVVPMPYLIYNLYVFATNPIMKAWQDQNLLPSPHPLHYVLGYGLLTLLSLPAIRWAWRRGRHKTAYLLLPAWVIAGPVLAYLPISVQRRLLEGIFVPLCILAVIGLRYYLTQAYRHTRTTQRRWQRSTITVLCLTLPTTILLLTIGTLNARQDVDTFQQFHDVNQIAALDWLNANAPPDAIVLSNEGQGNYVPARTDLRAFIGHGSETIQFNMKRDLTSRLLSGAMPLGEMRNVFDSYGVQYLLISPDDPQNNLLNDTLLTTLVYNKGGYLIYKIK